VAEEGTGEVVALAAEGELRAQVDVAVDVHLLQLVRLDDAQDGLLDHHVPVSVCVCVCAWMQLFGCAGVEGKLMDRVSISPREPTHTPTPPAYAPEGGAAQGVIALLNVQKVKLVLGAAVHLQHVRRGLLRARLLVGGGVQLGALGNVPQVHDGADVRELEVLACV
jgi:hypothetical protein